MKRNGMPP